MYTQTTTNELVTAAIALARAIESAGVDALELSRRSGVPVHRVEAALGASYSEPMTFTEMILYGNALGVEPAVFV